MNTNTNDALPGETNALIKELDKIASLEAEVEVLCGVLSRTTDERNQLRKALAATSKPEPLPNIGTEWQPCMKLPIVVHVREQRSGETHVSSREGITPVKSDDLIMRGVAGEEYPIGRELFERTYKLVSEDSKPEPTPSQRMKEAGFTRRPGLDNYNEEVYGSEPATPPASTPEVVAYMVERPVDVGVGMDQEVILSWEPGLEDEPSEPLIALTSHLDAVAKKDAALKVCVDAANRVIGRLQMDINDGSRPDQWSMEDLVRKLNTAITQAKYADTHPHPTSQPKD